MGSLSRSTKKECHESNGFHRRRKVKMGKGVRLSIAEKAPACIKAVNQKPATRRQATRRQATTGRRLQMSMGPRQRETLPDLIAVLP